MPRRVVKVVADEDPALMPAQVALLRDGITLVQQDMELTPEFSPEVEATARQAAGNPRLPSLDRTDIPFVTIDPVGAHDLDQALHIERDGSGFVVHYAIADVAAFVSPGDPVDEEANRRGETLYGADSKIPLHPPVLSEGAASLLPDTIRPALLWTIKVDAEGEGTDVAGRACAGAQPRAARLRGCAAQPRRRHRRRGDQPARRGRHSCGSAARRTAAGSPCRCRSRSSR